MAPKRPRAGRTPAPAYSPGRTLLVTALLVGAVLAGLLAVANPVAVGATAAGAVAGVVAGRQLPRLAARRTTSGSPTLCVPRTDVCVGA